MINKVTLIGNLGADPEVRHLDSGVMVARLSLATNENYKDKDGVWQKLTEWHNVVAWRELAERAEKTMKKGMLVYVEGKISYRKYTDSNSNTEKYVTDIVASTMRLLERPENSSESRFPAAEPSYMAARQGNGAVVAPPMDTTPAPVEGDDPPF